MKAWKLVGRAASLAGWWARKRGCVLVSPQPGLALLHHANVSARRRRRLLSPPPGTLKPSLWRSRRRCWQYCCNIGTYSAHRRLGVECFSGKVLLFYFSDDTATGSQKSRVILKKTMSQLKRSSNFRAMKKKSINSFLWRVWLTFQQNLLFWNLFPLKSADS